MRGKIRDTYSSRGLAIQHVVQQVIQKSDLEKILSLIWVSYERTIYETKSKITANSIKVVFPKA